MANKVDTAWRKGGGSALSAGVAIPVAAAIVELLREFLPGLLDDAEARNSVTVGLAVPIGWLIGWLKTSNTERRDKAKQ